MKPEAPTSVENSTSTSSGSGVVTSSQPAMQQEKKRRGCFPIILILLLLFGVLATCGIMISLLAWGSAESAGENVLKEGEDGKVAVIFINGVITQGDVDNSFNSEIGATESAVVADLEKALGDDEVKAVLLRIESPGGEVVASDVIYRKVLEVRAKKPVVAYSASMAASGGYYIAAASDYFITHQSVITGSIGVILETTSLAGLYEKLGIESRTFKSGALKDDSGLYDADPNGEAEKVFQSVVDQAYDEFVGAVAQGRGMDVAKVRELADGRIYTGKQAEANGLVDQVGYFEDAVAKSVELAGGGDLSVVQYYRDPSFNFLSLLGGKISERFGVKSAPEVGVKAYYLIDME